MQWTTLLAARSTEDDVELHTYDDLGEALSTAVEAASNGLSIALVCGASAPPTVRPDPLEVLAEAVVQRVPPGQVWLGPGAHALLPWGAPAWDTLGIFHVGGLDRHLYRLRHESESEAAVDTEVDTEVDVDTEPRPPPPMMPAGPKVASRSDDWRDAHEQQTADFNRDDGYDFGDDESTLPPEPRPLVVGDDGLGIDLSPDDPAWVERAMTVTWVVGFAILALPFQRVFAGYEFQLVSEAPWWVIDRDDAVTTVDVGTDRVLVSALQSGCAIDGRPVPAWEAAELPPDSTLTAGTATWRYVPVEARGYRGLLLGGPPSPLRAHVGPGQQVAIGRQLGDGMAGLHLPNRVAPQLRFCEGEPANQARTDGFTMDRALTGRTQDLLEMDTDGRLVLTHLHPRCPTFVQRDGVVRRVVRQTELHVGDRLLMGISILEIGPFSEAADDLVASGQ